MTGAQTLIWLAQLWAGAGAVVALGFLTRGLGQIDENARGAVTFRPLLVPGIVALWPLVLWRWWVLATGRDQWALRHAPPRRVHGPVAALLAVLVGITLLGTYAIRQSWPADVTPVQLEEGTGS